MFRGLMLSRTKTHVRREKSSEKSINGQWCPLSAICRLKTHRFRHIFHCPQYSDLSDKKSLTCETVPLSVKPRLIRIRLHRKWHIPELARQIYPWVSWLYQEYYGLAGAFLVIGLFFGLAELWAGRMRFVGLSHKERREYADRYKRDNKRPAPFSVLASLDSPGRMVRARRHVWNYAYWLTGAAGLALLGGLVVAVFIESWGETVLRPDLYANADYYLLQPANLFGIASVRGRAGCRDCVGAAAGVPAA